MKTLYKTSVTVSGGRDGFVESDDAQLKLALSIPKQLGGPGKSGATNPEQLFAAGYAACFESAIRHVARSKKVSIPELSVVAEIGLIPASGDRLTSFALTASLHPRFSGLEQSICEELVRAAHQVCPYSKATRGNVDVAITVNDVPLV